jgi:beta-glucosidase
MTGAYNPNGRSAPLLSRALHLADSFPFSGKLSISVPRNVGTLPVYYNYLKGARSNDPGEVYDNGTIKFGQYVAIPSLRAPLNSPTHLSLPPSSFPSYPHGSQYVTSSPTPLFAFGHGLGYSNFTYSSLGLSGQNVSAHDWVTASVEVTNEGKHDGWEVVQIYFTDIWSSVVTPVKQLVGFNKTMIA